MTLPDKIFLVGMPGSGKSSVGKKLAVEIDYKFIDLDDVIEGKANTTISKIFSEKGEDYFRELEALSLTEVTHNNSKVVVATGGGAPCYHDGMQYIKEYGFSIYLQVGLRTLTDRLSGASHRPLINKMNQDDLTLGVKEKLSKREPVYLESDLIVVNEKTSLKAVVEDILSQIRS